MLQDLKKWIKDNEIVDNWLDEDIVEIGGIGKCYVFLNGDENVFNEDFHINLLETDYEELEYDLECKQIIYKFGNVWYYTPVIEEKSKMIPLQNVGEAFIEIDEPFINLGVHGKQEYMNGSGEYIEWAKRAKFLGQKALGICEKNTLSGSLLFQKACHSVGINPVQGMTVSIEVQLEDGNYEIKEAKLYVKNKIGWVNLMNIANHINNTNVKNRSINLDLLIERSEGLSFVFGQKWIPCEDELLLISSNFTDYYYQIDTTEYKSTDIDIAHLNYASEYFGKYGYYCEKLKPILISDSYYVNKYDHKVKKSLNFVTKNITFTSEDQYLRSFSHQYDKFQPLFSEDKQNDFEVFISIAAESTMEITMASEFEIDTNYLHMPEYELTSEEKRKYGDKYGLYEHIIDSNWVDKVPAGKEDEYEDRLEEEFRVIDGNGFLDYFLMNWDWIVKCCKARGIYTGPARGSAGGSLLAYLMQITDIDPIKNGLIFERFLNEGRLKKTVKTTYINLEFDNGAYKKHIDRKILQVTRDGALEYLFAKEVREGDLVGDVQFKVSKVEKIVEEKVTAGSPPDIDTDVESARRDEIKQYLEERYGKHRVFSIGTNTTLGLKSGISDIGRSFGIGSAVTRPITKMISQKEVTEGMDFAGFFNKAQGNKAIKEFINGYPDTMETVRVAIGSSKATSVHASGVVITPRFRDGEEMNAWDWVPTKFHDGQLISEWDGSTLEDAGILKLDLLGLNTLDQIKDVIKKIKESTGETIVFEDIYRNKLGDSEVFKMFSRSQTQGVFQFASEDMTKFVAKMKPDCNDDLVAGVALFRPATMNLGFHEDFVDIKHGEKEVEYDWGLEEITKNTNGIMIYQEQMMKATQIIGGFSLQEADAIRKAMGKKKKDIMDAYKKRFLEGAEKNECPENDAIKIWNKIEQGSSYGFNLSHSAAYSLLSYTTAWLKAHYMLQFYTMSLELVKDDKRDPYISEINSIEKYDIVAPCVNKSKTKFVTDYDVGKIYWALTGIKNVGPVAVEAIMNQRELGGNFSTFNDFLERTKDVKVNKTNINNLISAGAFDEIVGLQHPTHRYELIKYYAKDFRGDEVDPIKFPSAKIGKEFFWTALQNSLTGLGNIDFKRISASSAIKKEYRNIQYITPDLILESNREGKTYMFAASISEAKSHAMKNGGQLGRVVFQSNDISFSCIFWESEWDKFSSLLLKSKGKIVVFNAKISLDKRSGQNSLYSYKKTKIEVIQ